LKHSSFADEKVMQWNDMRVSIHFWVNYFFKSALFMENSEIWSFCRTPGSFAPH